MDPKLKAVYDRLQECERATREKIFREYPAFVATCVPRCGGKTVRAGDKFWLRVANKIRSRGANDAVIAVLGGSMAFRHPLQRSCLREGAQDHRRGCTRPNTRAERTAAASSAPWRTSSVLLLERCLERAEFIGVHAKTLTAPTLLFLLKAARRGMAPTIRSPRDWWSSRPT
jgi:hypothetical protein